MTWVTANWFAYFAMFAWPGVCIVLFVMLPLEAAAIWSLFGALLLLPSNLLLDLHLLPPLDKMSIAGISTALLCMMKGTPTRVPRQSIFVYLLAIAFVISPIFTAFDNSYELRTAKESIPGFYPLDGLKLAGRNLLALAPFYVGSRYLCTEKARELLLKVFPISMLIYSLPMLFEIRMSPQLHRWVYGYFPHESFAQQMRNGGFRPVVFFQHGLALAMFTSLALIAAIVLIRARSRILYAPAWTAAGYLSGLLVLCKSLGPVIYTAIFAPLVAFTRPRTWVTVACAIFLIVCAYPALRGNGWIPVDAISRAATDISIDRSKSFQTRVLNEDRLLAKANEKPWLGWGTWGRNRVYDADTGKDISITDGGWIIQFGMYGWLGYLSLFGLLAAAGLRALRSIDSNVTRESLTLGGLTLLLAVYVADQIPNGSQLGLTFLLAGTVANAGKLRAARAATTSIARRPKPANVPAE